MLKFLGQKPQFNTADLTCRAFVSMICADGIALSVHRLREGQIVTQIGDRDIRDFINPNLTEENIHSFASGLGDIALLGHFTRRKAQDPRMTDRKLGRHIQKVMQSKDF